MLLLVKFFDRREYAEELHRTGCLHMNTLRYFRKVEDGALRGDTDEGITTMYQPSQLGSITWGDIVLPVGDLSGPVKVRCDDEQGLHVFCLHALTPTRFPAILDSGAPAIDEENFRFGGHAVVIYQPRQFLDRILAVADRNALHLQARLVTYDDYARRHGDVGPFVKSDDYRYQSEYRVVVAPSGQDVYRLAVGSLEDISHVVKVEEISRNIQIAWRSDRDSVP